MRTLHQDREHWYRREIATLHRRFNDPAPRAAAIESDTVIDWITSLSMDDLHACAEFAERFPDDLADARLGVINRFPRADRIAVDTRCARVDVIHLVARAKGQSRLGDLEPGTKLMVNYDDVRQAALTLMLRNVLIAIAHEHRYPDAPDAADLRRLYEQVRAFHDGLTTMSSAERSAVRRLVHDVHPDLVPNLVTAVQASACP